MISRVEVLLCVTALSAGLFSAADTFASIVIKQKSGQAIILVNKQPVATYVYSDPKIRRPYFAHVKTLSGKQVTRNHPPVASQDQTDHAEMHPGIWMAFGDLNGFDYWRNKATVKHIRFSKKPTGGKTTASFTEEKHYLGDRDSVICVEDFTCTLQLLDIGYLLIWDSHFHAKQQFYFGDQEEMGLGFRVATPICELKGGTLSDSTGRRTAKAIWSQSAEWCDYSATIDNEQLGMTLFCHPENFRPSWMHARNYGLLVANAFGRKAMQKGTTSKYVVKPKESLRLRYAIWIYQQSPNQHLSQDRIKQKYQNLVK